MGLPQLRPLTNREGCSKGKGVRLTFLVALWLTQWGEGSQMLVDAGDGVVSQLLAAQVSLQDVKHVALTHPHSDHILGYPAFVWGTWGVGRSALHVIGPAGTADMHERLVKGFYYDQAE